mmetsp:Transcript_23889/g.56921  ORF Transcript_23889/g.56921 Transcript_23889/m.56921 type:complete len:209 (+) Transcript_23889:571-1197(+)
MTVSMASRRTASTSASHGHGECASNEPTDDETDGFSHTASSASQMFQTESQTSQTAAAASAVLRHAVQSTVAVALRSLGHLSYGRRGGKNRTSKRARLASCFIRWTSLRQRPGLGISCRSISKASHAVRMMSASSSSVAVTSSDSAVSRASSSPAYCGKHRRPMTTVKNPPTTTMRMLYMPSRNWWACLYRSSRRKSKEATERKYEWS